MTRGTVIAVLCLFAASVAALRAEEAGIRFSAANELYRAGKYREAAAAYGEIIANGYESPALYYNLGNTLFKTGDIPAAILNFERAARLSPGDDDIRHNLRLANLRIIDNIEPVPQLFFQAWWGDLVGSSSSAGWGTAAVSALWLAAILLAAYRLNRSPLGQRLLLLGGVVAVLFSLFAFTAGAVQDGREASGSEAILFTPSVSVKSAPDTQSADLFVLHEGVKMDLLDSVGEWRKIRLADGKIGWLPAADLQVI